MRMSDSIKWSALYQNDFRLHLQYLQYFIFVNKSHLRHPG